MIGKARLFQPGFSCLRFGVDLTVNLIAFSGAGRMSQGAARPIGSGFSVIFLMTSGRV